MAADRIILGVDPGSRCMGYGLVLERSGVLSLVEAGVVRPAEEAMSARLGSCTHGSRSRCMHIFHTRSRGECFARNSASALKLGQARGAILVACGVHGAQVFGYEPTLVKKSLVGAGRAEKSQGPVYGRTTAGGEARLGRGCRRRPGSGHLPSESLPFPGCRGRWSNGATRL